MIKRLNIRNIIVLVIVLLVFHFGTGFLISPLVSKIVITQMNKISGVSVYADNVSFWPLTLSFSLKNFKVFDPDDQEQRIVEVKDASARLSLIGIFSKRIVLSSVNVSGARINLRGEPDGTFNIQKLSKPKGASGKIVLEQGAQAIVHNKDMFNMAYDLVKDKFSKEALEKQKNQQASASKAARQVINIPKGRKVYFRRANNYVFEIKKLTMHESYIDLKSQDSRSVQVDNALIELDDLAFDPVWGARLGRASVAGDIKDANDPLGSLIFDYQSSFSQDGRDAKFDLKLKDVKLAAMRFIYENSLPVELSKGVLNLESTTTLDNNIIDSHNMLSLSGHEFKPRNEVENSDSFMPMPILCQIINNTNPMNLDFTISGTVEKPQFSGFTKSLMKIAKPNLKNIKEIINSKAVSQGLGGLLDKIVGSDSSQGDSSDTGQKKTEAQDVINSIQSIFGTKNKDTN